MATPMVKLAKLRHFQGEAVCQQQSTNKATYRISTYSISRDPKPGSVYQATMEVSSANLLGNDVREEVQFSNLKATRSNLQHYGSGQYSARLNAGNGLGLGPNKLIRLQKNDVVKASVMSFYTGSPTSSGIS